MIINLELDVFKNIKTFKSLDSLVRSINNLPVCDLKGSVSFLKNDNDISKSSIVFSNINKDDLARLVKDFTKEIDSE
jgi:hypothetical protein